MASRNNERERNETSGRVRVIPSSIYPSNGVVVKVAADFSPAEKLSAGWVTAHHTPALFHPPPLITKKSPCRKHDEHSIAATLEHLEFDK
jgi:hypothetical protein